MNEPVLPGLPEPALHALVEGNAMQGGEYRSLSQEWDEHSARFSEKSVRALQIATWNAARDHFAGLCDKRVIGDNNREDQEAARCAAAIRQSPDPKETT